MAARARVRRLAAGVGLAALGALVALQVASAGSAGRDRRGSRMRVRILSWNVGKIFFKWDSRAADEDFPALAEVLREVDPDVVALQELRDGHQLARLQALLGQRYVGKVPEGDRYDRRVGLLVKPRPGLEFREVVTSTGRAALAARFEVGDAAARVVAVHLDAFDPRVRRVQAEEIVDWINRGGERDVFLTGDFNFDADVLRAQAYEGEDLRLYRFLVREFEDLGRRAGVTTIASRRLDYIFARSRAMRARDVRVLDGRRRNLMDHDPIVGEFELAAAPPIAGLVR